MPNLSLTKIVSIVSLSMFTGYLCFRLITSSEFILNMAGYVFSTITILTLGSYFLYKNLEEDTDHNNGEVY